MSEEVCWCGDSVLNGVCQGSAVHDLNKRVETVITRLYVAGPMTGYEECNYPAFHAAAAALREMGYTVVNPAENTTSGRYEDLLRQDLQQMLLTEGVATLPGWEESNGARNEVSVANVLKMPVRPVADWLAEVWVDPADETSQAADLGLDLTPYQV